MATCEELWQQYQQAHDAKVAQEAVIAQANAALAVANADLAVSQAEVLVDQQVVNEKQQAVANAYQALMPLWMAESNLYSQMQSQNCPFPGNA